MMYRWYRDPKATFWFGMGVGCLLTFAVGRAL